MGIAGDTKEAKKTPWLMFDSSVSMTYDPEVVNHTVFAIEVPVAIPLTIQYKYDIPDIIIQNQLLRFFFLRVLFLPSIIVKLTTINTPPWADIYFSTDELHFGMGNMNQTLTTTLIILNHYDAPAQPYTLRMKANTSITARTHKAEAYTDLTFTPEYLPYFSVVTAGAIQAPPDQLTFIPFTVRNLGNDVTKITGEITNTDELIGWTVYITPEAYLPADPSRQINLTFFCIPPFDFEGNQTIKLYTIATQWSNPDGPYQQLDLQTTVHYT
jgi:hypothetical protein